MEHEVLIVGIGGQGIQLVGKTLALAATDAGLNAMLAADYGGEMRGGASKTSVVIGDGPLKSLPVLPSAGAAIVMHDKFTGPIPDRLRPDGLLVLNSSIVDPATVDAGERRVVALPVTEMARELGAPQSAGLVILGAFARVTDIVDTDRLVAAMTGLLPPYRKQHVEANARPSPPVPPPSPTSTTPRCPHETSCVNPPPSEGG